MADLTRHLAEEGCSDLQLQVGNPSLLSNLQQLLELEADLHQLLYDLPGCDCRTVLVVRLAGVETLARPALPPPPLQLGLDVRLQRLEHLQPLLPRREVDPPLHLAAGQRLTAGREQVPEGRRRVQNLPDDVKTNPRPVVTHGVEGMHLPVEDGPVAFLQ